MISMTTYWQQFKDCLDQLLSSDQLSSSISSELNQRLISTANKLVKVGLTIEKMGITQIKGVADELHDISKQFNNKIIFPFEGKDYTYNLPKIDDKASLSFAILYYQHLSNYAQAEYQGEIYWGRSFVDKSVEAKRRPTHIQAMAMLEQIKSYYCSQDITLDEKRLLKQQDESANDYVKRLLDTLTDEQPKNPLSKLSEVNEAEKLQQSLSNLKSKEQKILAKVEKVLSKLSAYHLASQQYIRRQQQWQNQGLFKKLFYWLISWFHTSPLAQRLQEAQDALNNANEVLHEETGDQNAGLYFLNLCQQVEEIDRGQIILQQEIEQSQLKSQPRSEQPPKKVDKDMTSMVDLEQLSSGTSFMSLSQYYAFFTDNMPSRQTLQVVALGVAAAATQIPLMP